MLSVLELVLGWEHGVKLDLLTSNAGIPFSLLPTVRHPRYIGPGVHGHLNEYIIQRNDIITVIMVLRFHVWIFLFSDLVDMRVRSFAFLGPLLLILSSLFILILSFIWTFAYNIILTGFITLQHCSLNSADNTIVLVANFLIT